MSSDNISSSSSSPISSPIPSSSPNSIDQELRDKIETETEIYLQNAKAQSKLNDLMAQRLREESEVHEHNTCASPIQPRQYNARAGYGELIPVPRDFLKGDMYGDHSLTIPYNDPLSILKQPLAVKLGLQEHQLAITNENACEIKKLLNGPGNGLETVKPFAIGKGIIGVSDTYVAALDSPNEFGQPGQMVVIYTAPTGSVKLGTEYDQTNAFLTAKDTIASEFGPARARSDTLLSDEIRKDLPTPIQSLKEKSMKWLSKNWKHVAAGAVVIGLSVAIGYYTVKKH